MNLLYYSLYWSGIRWMAITHFRNNPISCCWAQWMKWKESHRGLGKIFLLIHSLKENVHITPNKSIQKSSTLMGRSTNTTVLHKPLKMSHDTDRPLEKQQNKKQNNSTIMNKHKRKWVRHHEHQHKLTYGLHMHTRDKNESHPAHVVHSVSPQHTDIWAVCFISLTPLCQITEWTIKERF